MELLNKLITYSKATLTSKKRVSYLGWVGRQNLGDEVLFCAYKKLFDDYTLIPYSSKFDKITDTYEKITSKPFYHAACLGGGTLIRKSYMPIFAKLIEHSKFAFIMGAGVDDCEFWKRFDIFWNLQDLQETLSKVDIIGVRGPRSAAMLREINIPCQVIGDTALFFAQPKYSPKKKLKNLLLNIGSANNRVFGDEALIYHQVTEIINHLLQDNWHVTILYVYPKDREIAISIFRQLKQKSKSNSLQLLDSVQNYHSFKLAAERADILLGYKLHSVILAHCFGTPAIMLAYQNKCFDYMESMALEKYCHRTDNLNNSEIIDQIYEIYSNIEYHQDHILSWTNKYKHEINKMADNIKIRINHT